MDAAFSFARLSDELHGLLDARDYEGAEELLLSVMSAAPERAAFFHLQLGRVYSRWNKLSSALNHFGKAVEMVPPNDFLLFEITQEIRAAQDRQADQAP